MGLDYFVPVCDISGVRVIERFFSGVPHPHLLGVCHPDIGSLAAKCHSPFDKTADFGHCIRVKPKRIRLFIKPYCGWCHKAIRWLDEREVAYTQVDVIADEAAYHEMIQLSGQELAPVLEVDGKILADFGPEQLADFWKQLEK